MGIHSVPKCSFIANFAPTLLSGPLDSFKRFIRKSETYLNFAKEIRPITQSFIKTNCLVIETTHQLVSSETMQIPNYLEPYKLKQMMAECDFPHVHTRTQTPVPLCFISLSHETEPTFYKAPLPSKHCTALRETKCLTLLERGGPLPCLWSQWRQMTGHTYITHMHERAPMPLERLLSIHVMLAFLTSPRACNGWRSESRL